MAGLAKMFCFLLKKTLFQSSDYGRRKENVFKVLPAVIESTENFMFPTRGQPDGKEKMQGEEKSKERRYRLWPSHRVPSPWVLFRPTDHP